MTEIEKAKKISEVSKKLESAKREMKQYKDYLESDIRFIRDTGRNAGRLKSAGEKVQKYQKELDRLM